MNHYINVATNLVMIAGFWAIDKVKDIKERICG